MDNHFWVIIETNCVGINELMKLNTGTVFCVPVPPELSLPKEEMDKIIDEAVGQAEVGGIAGKELTPFLLSKVWEASKGRSLNTNVGFVKNNAILAAQIAVSLSGKKV